MEKPKFEFYERPNGHNEFLEFLENLPQKDQAKLMAVIYEGPDTWLVDCYKNEMGKESRR